MKLIRKLVTGLMILLVVLGSTPLEVFAYVPDLDGTEWPTISNNGTASTLPQPPAAKNIVDLSEMFNYPTLDYSRIPRDPANEKILDFSSNKSYVTKDDSSVAVLTRDSTWQSGVMWSLDNYKVKLDEPFHMVSYVYLGNKGQQNRGADGITFTMHNDNKEASSSEAGSTANTGNNAYGALGNGLGVYGNHFSGADNSNVYVQMKKGVTNGIALEFDTFYNDENGLNGKQFSDNDLWSYARPQGSYNSNFGHIGINYLNNLQQNRANEDYTTLQPPRYKKFSTDVYDYNTMIKHSGMLAVGWDGTIKGLDPSSGWQIDRYPSKPLADNKWHRLEVKWTPKTDTTGDLTYLINRDGYDGEPRKVYSIDDDTLNDASNVLTYKIENLDVEDVFKVNSTADSVYWGFSGSTGGYQNNQAVQMLQLPVNYYTAELNKVDQDRNPVSGAQFQIEKKDENGKWIKQQFCNPEVDTLKTGSQEQEKEICNGVFQTLGGIKLTQLTAGTYRWKEEAPAEGYQKNQEQQYSPDKDGFVVNYQNPTFTTKAENKKLYQLELNKTDSDTKKPLNDVPFIISKTVKTENENDKQYYLKLNAKTTGFEWTEFEEEAEKFFSGKSYALDENGKISGQAGDDGKLIVKYFPDAPNLSWEEVEVPKGYDSSGTFDTLTGYFTASTDGYVYSATQTNTPIYQVSLEKKASDTEKALSGAVFSLQKKVDQNWETVSQDGVSEFTTNSEGKISISNLTAGTYRWKEVTAPDGYQISQPDPYVFEVTRDSVTRDSDGNLAIDPDTNNYIINPTVVTNAPRDFKLTLEKLSSTFKQPLKGVEFKLYDSDDSAGEPDFSTLTLEAIVTTDAYGKIVLNNEQIQADKTYYLVESQTVDGFIQLEGYFTITTSKTNGFGVVTYTNAKTETDESPPFEFTKEVGDNYSGHLTIYNKRRELILPNTGGIGTLAFTLVGGAIMTGTALVGRKKKKEEE